MIATPIRSKTAGALDWVLLVAGAAFLCAAPLHGQTFRVRAKPSPFGGISSPATFLFDGTAVVQQPEQAPRRYAVIMLNEYPWQVTNDGFVFGNGIDAGGYAYFFHASKYDLGIVPAERQTLNGLNLRLYEMNSVGDVVGSQSDSPVVWRRDGTITTFPAPIAEDERWKWLQQKWSDYAVPPAPPNWILDTIFNHEEDRYRAWAEGYHLDDDGTVYGMGGHGYYTVRYLINQLTFGGLGGLTYDQSVSLLTRVRDANGFRWEANGGPATLLGTSVTKPTQTLSAFNFPFYDDLYLPEIYRDGKTNYTVLRDPTKEKECDEIKGHGVWNETVKTAWVRNGHRLEHTEQLADGFTTIGTMSSFDGVGVAAGESVQAFNRDGWAVVYAAGGQGMQLWRGATGPRTPLCPLYLNQPVLNARTVTVTAADGTSSVQPSPQVAGGFLNAGSSTPIAVLLEENTGTGTYELFDLNKISGVPAGWTLERATDINNQGVITALAANPATSQSKGAILLPAELMVDANRDGRMSFTDRAIHGEDGTSEQRPYRFWINNDDDSNEEDHPDSTQRDSADNIIQSQRDLEDFVRLHFRIDTFQQQFEDGTLQVGLEWKNTGGTTPAIKVYKSYESDGGDGYLKDVLTALQQTANTEFKTALAQVSAGVPAKLDKSVWTRPNLQFGTDSSFPNGYLLFEGVTEGKGQLVMTVWKGNQKIADGPSVWLDLKNIKKMYQRVDSAVGHPWENVAFEPEPNERRNDVIVFVHGWRMSPPGASSFAETMYKRLWHRGFTGRFAAFHWDTWWFNNWQWVDDLGGGPIEAALSQYNDSEHTAWQSGAALKAFVDGLPFLHKNVTAHSMGNIVAGEALRLGMQASNYALLQAAVPAACYDDSESIRQVTQYQNYGFTMWDADSPDDDPDSLTRSLAYRGRFRNVSGNLVNFFLPLDYATFIPWEIDNDQSKPPDGQWVTNFGYLRTAASGQKLYKYQGVELDHYLRDPYEAMPYACRSWGKTAGAFGATAGSIASSVDLSNSTYQLPGQQESGFGDQHSGEFNASIQQLKPFYDTLMDKLRVQRNQ